MTRTRHCVIATLCALVLAASACGSDSTGDTDSVTLTLLAHESFTPSEGIFDAFTAATGIEVDIVTSADAGTLVSKAALTAGNPEGDVLWGVDNTLLSRALDAGVFEPYRSALADSLPQDLLALVPGDEATPVDTGQVCVNYDIDALDAAGVEPPQTFDDLIEPDYAGMLVVPSPATSSPGLAFMLATIAAYGEDGWTDWWSSARANDVEVVDGWSQAYYSSFTRAGGDRPLVISYASSPPAEIVFADPPLPEGSPAPTGVVTATCFQQVEFAGVLAGTDHPAEARRLIDFLVDVEFQSDLPLTQFVDPVNPEAMVPGVYADNVVRADDVLTLDPALIATGRADWIDEWTTIVLR
jgi:thiamine transport system substrate-binding protein